MKRRGKPSEVIGKIGLSGNIPTMIDDGVAQVMTVVHQIGNREIEDDEAYADWAESVEAAIRRYGLAERAAMPCYRGGNPNCRGNPTGEDNPFAGDEPLCSSCRARAELRALEDA